LYVNAGGGGGEEFFFGGGGFSVVKSPTKKPDLIDNPQIVTMASALGIVGA